MSLQIKETFFSKVKKIVRMIPKGKVATYGMIASLCGNPRMARNVAYALSSSSEKEDIPWHRVVNRLGKISLRRSFGYEIQKSLLEKEGVFFDTDEAIPLDRYLWNGSQCSLLQDD